MIDNRKHDEPALDDLRLAIDRLTNGLRQSIETQATHTIMLKAILEALTAPLEPERDLADVCAQILAALKDQTEIFAEMHRSLTEPPLETTSDSIMSR